MLVTGNQLRAARALAGVDQFTAAGLSGVAVNTIRNLEQQGSKPIRSNTDTLRRIHEGYMLLGIEFPFGSYPGVRLHVVTIKASRRPGGDWGISVAWDNDEPLLWISPQEARRKAAVAGRAN